MSIVYEVEPEQEPSEVSAAPVNSKKGEKRYPRVCVPVSQEIIDSLEMGDECEITLRGKIVGLESSEGSDWYSNRKEVRIELSQVEADPVEGDGEEAEDESMQDAIDKGLGYKKDAEE